MLTAALRRLARLHPWPVEVGFELERALTYLAVAESAETVVRAGYGAALLALGCALPLAVVVPASLALLLACSLAVCIALAGRRGPVLLATLDRTAALGAAPNLVGRAVLRMRIEPTAERAAVFAASSARGRLAASLNEHVRRAAGTPRTGLDGFAREWKEWFPSLHRAAALVEAAARAPAAERDRTLDRAQRAVLDGARDRMAAFAADVRGPAAGIYAFGVLLPLALVGVLPAAQVAGLPVSVTTLAVVYDLLLPAGLLGAGVWLLARRPVAFPPPEISRSHPDVPDAVWPAVVGGCLGGGVALGITSALFSPWTRPVALVGGAAGTALYVRYRPQKAVRDHVRAVESGLPDALYLVGRRVSEGTAVEAAIERAADELDGETGAMLAEAATVQRRLGAGVEEAMLGEYGALSAVPSPRTRSAAALLAVAAREGRPAGDAVVATADHLEELRRVEREARHELGHVTGTLRSTAALFGPLVAGATVALADGMSGAATRSAGGEAMATGDLGIAVGVYVLSLAATLTALAASLERGFDRALVGYQVGSALLCATAVYVAAATGAGAIV